ncbi:MAG: DUF3105 domain-containing protein [Actinomycetes bacterium]
MGSNAQRRREEREQKIAQMRKDDTSRARRSNGLLTAGLVIAVVVAVVGVVWAVQTGTEDPTPGALEEVQVYSYKAAEHTDDPVEYDESPPVGGPHRPVWEECGYYDDEIDEAKAVHSLEHGAVWITYDPALGADAVGALKDRLSENYTLLSPYPDQSAPVVATAWNTQLELDGVDDPRLDDFVTEYRQGPQTPEPGASC